MTSLLTRTRLAALALAVALFAATAGPADAASKRPSGKAKHAAVKKAKTKAKSKSKAKRASGKSKRTVASRAAAPVAVVEEPVAPAPEFTSVIAIGGYVFYNLTYAEALEAYRAAVAAAPPGYTPPPVTSISVTTTVGN